MRSAGRAMLLGLLGVGVGATTACRRGSEVSAGDAGADGGVLRVSASDPADGSVLGASGGLPISDGPADAVGSGKPLLGITSYVATVYKEPRDTSKKLGYLRVGAKIPRSEAPVGKAGCPGGWYAIEPKGYVCAGEDATTDLDTPILKASRPPNLKTALPYHYAFVRAVLPMYMRVPTAAEEYKAEFKLKEHLDWYKENEREVTKVLLGANDVAIDDRGVPLPDHKLGEVGTGKNSQEIGIGQLLGGDSDNDPIPFWLEGGKRGIPNVSDYRTKGFEVFADRARRHTGLAFIGSFPTGPESLNRRFAITTDLRLVPATKVKPDTGSPWHGVELDDKLTLPLGFVRSQAARAYSIAKGKLTLGDALEYRSVLGFVGTQKTIEGAKYYRTTDKRWVAAQDVGLAIAPATWPDEAEKGKRWVEISITNQTLVLWEGKKPVYATLVSTGRDGLQDPKHSASTVRGSFHIRNKHISAMMDSNESSAVGGRADSTASRSSKGSTPADDDSPKEKPGEKGVPRKGDGEYGVTRRRGEGTFQLRDVPYIEYFESGYALHAAYWHDVFGTPRSHGCVNLAPVDAHRVFLFTEPHVPAGWHAVNAGEDMGEGSLVVIHE